MGKKLVRVHTLQNTTRHLIKTKSATTVCRSLGDVKQEPLQQHERPYRTQPLTSKQGYMQITLHTWHALCAQVIHDSSMRGILPSPIERYLESYHNSRMCLGVTMSKTSISVNCPICPLSKSVYHETYEGRTQLSDQCCRELNDVPQWDRGCTRRSPRSDHLRGRRWKGYE